MNAQPQLTVAGALGAHEVARDFAAVVQRVHHRYATEVVGAFRLCPFMNDPETAFGRFVVVLDREPVVDTAVQLVVESGVQVVHIIYPLVTAGASPFERFGNAVHQGIAAMGRGGPVHATFHPNMQGDTSSPSKMVGLVRRAPDPFVQFVPEGLHKGGSTFLDIDAIDLKTFAASPAEDTKSRFETLGANDMDRIASIAADIRTDRDRSYARYLDALADA